MATLSGDEVPENAARERENGRRAALCVIALVGSVLIFRLTGMIDLRVSIPTPVVYGAAGALYGALCGVTQRADELEDRVMHTLIGAAVMGVVFALFSLTQPPGPHKYWL